MRDTWKDRIAYLLIGIGCIIGIPLALWLAWLAIAAFLLYGYQGIVWVLG